ncbi:aromatic ring-hydroxylating oxygenase subunit alpha [Chitinasiproducens palmae]|uniref:Anthranilate 1,2-dioxygenase large subunit n=1 Tax=Chitinasiproducens palmae TaxID=1770053 RepID=A0A1H2PK54_9BURK|nr:Rieske 2Fe-2S domain-containing protein [Chitinasiproducens palmae]SDV46826.1 anthranilate 1,2-dioxygenase large subunit [Chitinasiproducens palmae]
MSVSPITWPAKDFSRVPFSIYHDPAVYLDELDKIFHGPTWNYLALEAELPNPGDFITTLLGETSVIVSRDAEGRVHAFVNRCKHRGATLRREACGNAKSHTCIYHQWAYSLDGRLQSVPFAKGMKGEGGLPKDFDKSSIRLDMLTVEVYKGVVFASFSPAAEPLADYLGPAVIAELDRLFARKVKVLGYQRQRIFGNWKLYNDNVRDPNHGGLLHMFHATFGLYRLSQVGGAKMDGKHRHNITYNQLGSDDTADNAGYDGTTKVFQEGYQLLDKSMLEYKRDYPDMVSLVILSVFPSVVFQQIANSLCTRQIRPRGVDEVELYWTYFGYEDDSEEMTRHRLLQANLAGPGGYISMEDGEAVQLVHETSARAQAQHALVEIGGTGEIKDAKNLISEVPIRGFWSYYCELMGFEAGTPRNQARVVNQEAA